MKFFIDCEFHENFHKPLFGRERHFIDLISIGMISETGRSTYMICRDFDIKAAWNSYQMEMVSGDIRNHYPNGIKNYWLRYNVLKPLFEHQLEVMDMMEVKDFPTEFNYKNFKRLIKLFGYTRPQIAQKILQFVKFDGTHVIPKEATQHDIVNKIVSLIEAEHEFYGYYADYDHVALCNLFGRMSDLPQGFPMYTIDLKQQLDTIAASLTRKDILSICFDEAGGWRPRYERMPKSVEAYIANMDLEQRLQLIKSHPDYPVSPTTHIAIDDARFNRKLHAFIENIAKQMRGNLIKTNDRVKEAE